VNIVSSKSVASWTGLVLGSQTNNAGSRVSSATGDIYKVCDLAENMKYVDITYAVLPKTGPTTPTLLSIPSVLMKLWLLLELVRKIIHR
jgi:hypothetical protein